MSHTPGPWVNDGWDNFNPEQLEPVCVIQAPTRIIVAFTYTDADTWEGAYADTECIANANLMATAPELLEALKLVMSKHMRSKKGGYWMQHGSFQDELDNFEALIAKAEGDTLNKEESR